MRNSKSDFFVCLSVVFTSLCCSSRLWVSSLSLRYVSSSSCSLETFTDDETWHSWHLKVNIIVGLHSGALSLQHGFLPSISNCFPITVLWIIKYGVTAIKPQVVMTVLLSFSPPYSLYLHYVANISVLLYAEAILYCQPCRTVKH